MNIAVIGLGLIGGSIAKGIKLATTHTVHGFDIEQSVIYKAKLFGAIDNELTDESLKLCDMVILAVYPNACARYLEEKAHLIKKSAIVMDCSGTKEQICSKLFETAKNNGFLFIGAHPMAGKEYSGFDNSGASIFQNASIILVPPKDIDIESLVSVKKFWGSIGFTNCVITDAKNHDKMIAFTSQLPHVVSNAYIKSEVAKFHDGYSAGSYRDLSRVARLNEEMWTELFFENKEHLADEIDNLIINLKKYSDALKENDRVNMKELLREGREAKEMADKGVMTL